MRNQTDDPFAITAQQLRYLIADPTGSRKSLRKLLSSYRISPVNIDVVENLTDAAELTRKKKPNVIFADYSLEAEGWLALLDIQKAVFADGPEPRVFFLSTQKDSNAVMSGAAEENVDAILLKPFTFESLAELFVAEVSRKVTASPYEQAINKGKALLRKEKPEEALIQFKAALSLDSRPTLALYWQGQALESLGNLSEARDAYAQGLRLDPTHYRCLLGTLETLLKMEDFEAAYETAKRLVDNHSIPVKHIPLMIRVSIYNKRFDEVLSFYKQADAISRIAPSASVSLSAGLVICGIWMLQRGQKDAAIDAFRKAEVSSRGNPKILQRILIELSERGLEAEMKSMLSRIPDEIKNSQEIRIAELEFLKRKPGAESHILKIALEMIRQGKADSQVYEIAIMTSLKLARKENHVKELVAEAERKFPQFAARFRNIFLEPKANS